MINLKNCKIVKNKKEYFKNLKKYCVFFGTANLSQSVLIKALNKDEAKEKAERLKGYLSVGDIVEVDY